MLGARCDTCNIAGRIGDSQADTPGRAVMEDSTRPQAEASKVRSGWSRPLARPVALRDGPDLVTLADVRTFLFKRLNDHRLETSNWRRVTALLLSAARSNEVDVADVTIALEMAASMDDKTEPK
jgi:hypothetical protein